MVTSSVHASPARPTPNVRRGRAGDLGVNSHIRSVVDLYTLGSAAPGALRSGRARCRARLRRRRGGRSGLTHQGSIGRRPFDVGQAVDVRRGRSAHGCHGGGVRGSLPTVDWTSTHHVLGGRIRQLVEVAAIDHAALRGTVAWMPLRTSTSSAPPTPVFVYEQASHGFQTVDVHNT